jgi:threonine-phosphate decarboxylase
MELMRTAGRKQKAENSECNTECMPDAGCGFRQDHGGNIYKIAEELGVPEESLIDFSASINPLGVSSRVKEAIGNALDSMVHYPDPDTKVLRHRISEHLNIEADSIICGNGSTELIYLVPRALKAKSVLVTAPTFSEYERACTLNCELRIKSYELRKKDSFEIKAREFIGAMQGCDMAFLCNPNNPTGHLLGRNAVLEIAEAAQQLKCYLVVDEAFIDFCPEASVIGYVEENPYLIVLRSMTKFYALTGVRVGFGVFHRDIIERIKDFKEPWTVNSLAQKAAIAALDDNSYASATIRLIKVEKEYVEQSLRERGVRFYFSAANYYLLEVANAQGMVQELRNKGLLVRDCSNFKGLDSTFIRIAVKSREQNEVLIKELSELCTAS